MEEMNNILIIAATFLLPLVILKLESKIKLIEWLSPVVSCYAAGILLGNVFLSHWDPKLARTLSEVSVMLALPLLLLSCDLMGWFKLAKSTIISFSLLVVSVMVVAYVCAKWFERYDPEVWKMAGMLVGVYVGGTANLTAVGKILGIRDEAFIVLNAVDLALGGVYLLFIMSAGVKLLTKILPAFDHTGEEDANIDHANWTKFSLAKKSIHSVVLVFISVATVGASVGLSYLLVGAEVASIIILSLSIIALALSLNKKLRHYEGSQEWGNYFLLAFCFAVGSMADVNQLFSSSLWFFAFTAIVMFGSILIHFTICYFLKIDRDTAIITSMAGIFGPAFVAPMSQVLKNRAILVSGVTTGLMGIAIGTFVGTMTAYTIKFGFNPALWPFGK